MESSHDLDLTGTGWPAGAPSVWTAIQHRWSIVVGCVVAAIAAASVLTLVTTPSYRASVDVMVSPTIAAKSVSDEYQASMIGISLATGYARLMNTADVARGVIRAVGLHESSAALQSRISAAPVTGTNLITVTVSDAHADTAAAIANAVPRQFNTVLTGLMNGRSPQASVIVVQSARVPPTAAEPRPAINLAIALVLGMLLGVTLAAGVERRIMASRRSKHASIAEPSPRRSQRWSAWLPWRFGPPGTQVGK